MKLLKQRSIYQLSLGLLARCGPQAASCRGTCEHPGRDQLLRCRKDVELDVCLMDEASIDPSFEQPRVVIVGAGMAGLSAANRLLQCGIDNFVVLEASDRPGGRIHTCWVSNIVFDLGAENIFGASPKNPVYALAAREGLLVETCGMESRKSLCLTSLGRPVSRLVDATAHHTMSLIEKQAMSLEGKPEAAKLSLWEFLSKRIQQEVEIYPKSARVDAACKLYGMTNDKRYFMGACLCDVALNQFGSKFGSYGPNALVPSGMVGILAPLLRLMPSCDHIRYCKKVDKIVWSEKLSENSDRVKVLCCDSTVYPADYVIVTIPLGVMKEKAANMFSPGLSDEKMNAIKKMGYGNCCKIVLEYERPFWVWGRGGLELGWSLVELMSRRSCPDWVKAIGTIDETVGSQQGLKLNVGGPEADVAEGLNDVRIAEDVTRVLRTFTGDSSLPYPANVAKSRWRADPLFRGARPYFKTGCALGLACELAMPMPEEAKGVPAVLFAGDAACPRAMGTLHGARTSGIREAERILKLTRKLAGRPRPEIVEEKQELICKQRKDNIAVKN